LLSRILFSSIELFHCDIFRDKISLIGEAQGGKNQVKLELPALLPLVRTAVNHIVTWSAAVVLKNSPSRSYKFKITKLLVSIGIIISIIIIITTIVIITIKVNKQASNTLKKMIIDRQDNVGSLSPAP